MIPQLITIQNDVNNILHSYCELVTSPLEIQKELNWMERYVKENHGLGMAAPQIGIPLQFFIFQYNRKMIHVINPTFTVMNDKPISIIESCFSCPRQQKQIKRFKQIEVNFMNREGKRITMQLNQLYSIVFQHEYDHLYGKLISD